MKIACLTYHSPCIKSKAQNSHIEPWQYVQSDSALLANRKPFFLPPFSRDVRVGACAVARICRMGKYVKQAFADRYFESITIGANFIAYDCWKKCLTEQKPWDEAVAFDNSLAIGEMLPYIKTWEAKITIERNSTIQVLYDGEIIHQRLAIAIEQISRFITLRIGDMIAIDLSEDWAPISQEDVIAGYINGEKKFECRIK